MGTTLQTEYGPILLEFQDHRTAYVLAGNGRNGDGIDSGEPLELGTGTVSVRAHLRRDGDGWRVHGGGPYLHRRDSSRDATATMMAKVVAALTRATADYAATPEGAEALEAAGWAKRKAEAANRRGTAAELRKTAAALEAEAVELENGGEVVYIETHLTSGFRETTRHVRTAAGELTDTVPEPPTVYGSSRYLDPASVRDRREVD
jgi:hypothetical protein